MTDDETHIQLKFDSTEYDVNLPVHVQHFFKTRHISDDLTGISAQKLNEVDNIIYFSYDFSFRSDEKDFDKLFKFIEEKIRGYFNLKIGIRVGLVNVDCENCVFINECNDQVMEECISNDLGYFKPDWDKEGIFIKQIR